jgi:hypothetical protein
MMCAQRALKQNRTGNNTAEISRGTRKGVRYLQRKGKGPVEREVLDWNPQGISSRGRPKKFATKQFSRKL